MKYAIALVLIFVNSLVFSQAKVSGVWLLPISAKRVNGVTLNVWKTIDVKSDTIQMNGIHLNVNPAAVAILPLLIPISLFPGGHDYYFPHKKKTPFSRVNGLSVECIDEKTRVNGLSISIMNLNEEMRGLALNGWISKSRSVYGFTASPFMNVNNEARGVQLALVNRCKDLKGIQIGLWNVNQKRKLPFVNWCFNKTED